MDVCVMSDLHGYLPRIKPCELVLLAGDLVDLYCQMSKPKLFRWYEHIFSEWANALPCDKVIFIAGNHEVGLQGYEKSLKSIFRDKVIFIHNENIRYLSRDNVEYNIFGTPYCKIFGNWAYNEQDTNLIKLYNKADSDTNIILSHDAPYGVSDVCLDPTLKNHEHLGNEPLKNLIETIKPQYCFHGHLHSSNHDCEILNETKVYNCSLLDERYNPVYKPLYIKL